MNEPTASQSALWQRRLYQLRQFVWRATPFAAGMLATLVALLLYNVFVPDPPQLTLGEVNE